MSQQTASNTLLFWVMVTLGAVLLAPCLILPAWFEFEAARQVEGMKQVRIEKLRARAATLKKQNEFRDDRAYLERLERQEFGGSPPGAQVIFVDPELIRETEAALAQRMEPLEAPVATGQELRDRVQALMLKYPVTQAFARSETRPALMSLGGGLILLAVILLCRATPEPAGG